MRNKLFDRPGKVRVNIGNIYFAQKKYLQAVKMYKMALDQISVTHQRMRNRVLKNIGHCFVLMGQYSEAVETYEHVLDQRPTREYAGQERKVPGRDFATAFNALLCYVALGDRDRMRHGFTTLLAQEISVEVDDERYLNLSDDAALQVNTRFSSSVSNVIVLNSPVWGKNRSF